MEEYRAYALGKDGDFNGFEPLLCADDAAATEKAKLPVNKHDTELWNGARLVKRLSPPNFDSTAE